MGLANFIESNFEAILQEWDKFASGVLADSCLDPKTLRDHAPDILLAAIRDIRSEQLLSLRFARTQSHEYQQDATHFGSGSEEHAINRLGCGFNLLQIISEYRALRASVFRLWHDRKEILQDTDADDVNRFNESIDQSLSNAVQSFTARVDQSRDMFLAILSHDLRNPLNSISMSADILPFICNPDAETSEVVLQISTNAQVMARMISDLLDYTRTRLGAGMPVSPLPMDLNELCQALYKEFKSAHPGRQISFYSEGEVKGNWDTDRLRQAISNLMGNAIQHSLENCKVDLSLSNGLLEARIAIHNEGEPIPPGELTRVFDPLVRGSSSEHPQPNRPGSIGLGLYIAREIAVSHGGSLDVTSTAESGTSFTLRIPHRSTPTINPPILDEKHIDSL